MATATAKPALAQPGARKTPRNRQTTKKVTAQTASTANAVEKRKEVFLQVGDNPGSARQRRLTGWAKDNVLSQAGFLDGFTQLEIVHYFQTQSFIGADDIIGRAAG